jgi:hypothetical protein
VALGIVEMQMQFAMTHMTPLLSVPAGQRNEHIVDKVYRCERCSLWQEVQSDKFVRIEEYRQHRLIDLAALII